MGSPVILSAELRRQPPRIICKLFEGVFLYPSDNVFRIQGKSIKYFGHSQYQDGKDINARLAWLATYMGHVDIRSTQVYLQPTVELLEQINGRFHRHYLQHATTPGATP